MPYKEAPHAPLYSDTDPNTPCRRIYAGPNTRVSSNRFSSGVGSAVTTVNAIANFEDVVSLNGNPYVENSLSFSRTNLTLNNRGCGFAGCIVHNPFYGGPTPFTGNGMFGRGPGSFSIHSTGDDTFTALEMLVSTGLNNTPTLTWSTFLAGALVSTGTPARQSRPALPSIAGLMLSGSPPGHSQTAIDSPCSMRFPPNSHPQHRFHCLLPALPC